MEDNKTLRDEVENKVGIFAYSGPEIPKEYLNFIRSRWIRSYRQNNDLMKLVDSKCYYFTYGAYIQSILDRPNTTVRLALLTDDPDVTLGFSVSQGRMLHYVEVPTSYRKQGIGRALVPFEVSWFSHLTKTGMRLWAEKAPEARFNPFI